MKIAVLGTGVMGYSVARRFLSSGKEVIVYNRTKSRALSLKKQGAQIADNAFSAVCSADYIITLLTDYSAINKVLFHPKLKTLEKKTVVQMSTILPRESFILKSRVEKMRGIYVECPVLGNKHQAEEGALLAMVGSLKAQFNKVKWLLKILDPSPKYIGNVPKAAALKLALNNLIAFHAAGFSLSLGLVEKEGINPGIFAGILRRSSLYAPMFDKKLRNWLKRDYDNPNFVTRHLLKDIELVIKEADLRNISSLVPAAIKKEVQKAITLGFGEKDYSSIFNAINRLC
ncbi:MAG: NAD(P)-dependent oxidoreductase [Candidatus Omnitrophica bacterium]|nr:NAD(P)-dependent oxidoreductase [Candidatus Omnitrophota bacterium]